jgi:gas vesicle protein
MAASLVGAMVGGLAGYLFFTDHGRTLRRRIEPALDDLARHLDSFRLTVQKAGEVASDGRKILSEAMGEGDQQHVR